MTVLCMSYHFSWTLPAWLDAYRPGGSPKRAGLGPTKVPQPGVDLINMAAPARSLASAVCTPEFEGLLPSSSVLVWNGRGGVAMKKARKEWHPPQKVRCPANVESRDRRGLIQLSNSVRLHGPRGVKEKILKGAEENQVESNVFRITVVATLGCTVGRKVHGKKS